MLFTTISSTLSGRLLAAAIEIWSWYVYLFIIYMWITTGEQLPGVIVCIKGRSKNTLAESCMRSLFTKFKIMNNFLVYLLVPAFHVYSKFLRRNKKSMKSFKKSMKSKYWISEKEWWFSHNATRLIVIPNWNLQTRVMKNCSLSS